MPNGPSRKLPAWRSSRLPNTLAESNDGMHSQSTEPSAAISAPVWQLERNAYSAIGGNGDGAAALCGADLGAGLVVLMTRSTGRASGHDRPPAHLPTSAPTTPARSARPVAARRAAAA